MDALLIIIAIGFVVLIAARLSSPKLNRMTLPELERLYAEGLSRGSSVARLTVIDEEIQRRDVAERERMKVLRASLEGEMLRDYFEGAYRGAFDAATEALDDERAAHEAGVKGVLKARQAFDPPLRGLRQDYDRILGWEARPFIAAETGIGRAAIVAYALWREGFEGADVALVRDVVQSWDKAVPGRRSMEAASMRAFKFPWLDFVP